MVKTVAHIALNDKYEYVDCVGDADEQTVSRAAQYKLEVETTDLLPTLLGCLEQARQECPKDFKVIVFCQTRSLNTLPGTILLTWPPSKTAIESRAGNHKIQI